MASWRQNPMTAVGAAVVLVIAVVLVVIAMQGPKVVYSLKCESCNTEFQAKLPKDVTFPVVCPSCGKTSAYQAIKMRCKACGKTFAHINKPLTVGTGDINVAGAAKPQRGGDPMGRCPHCGAQGQFETVQ